MSLNEASFVVEWNNLASTAHKKMAENGFWEYPNVVPEMADRMNQLAMTEKLALIAAEVSEALERVRKTGLEFHPDEHIPEFSNLAVEMSDIVLRIMDACAGFDLDIAPAIIAKLKYNMSRPKKHGKNF